MVGKIRDRYRTDEIRGNIYALERNIYKLERNMGEKIDNLEEKLKNRINYLEEELEKRDENMYAEKRVIITQFRSHNTVNVQFKYKTNQICMGKLYILKNFINQHTSEKELEIYSGTLKCDENSLNISVNFDSPQQKKRLRNLLVNYYNEMKIGEEVYIDLVKLGFKAENMDHYAHYADCFRHHDSNISKSSYVYPFNGRSKHGKLWLKKIS